MKNYAIMWKIDFYPILRLLTDTRAFTRHTRFCSILKKLFVGPLCYRYDRSKSYVILFIYLDPDVCRSGIPWLCNFVWKILNRVVRFSIWVYRSVCTVFENHRKSLIQHCERNELRLHFEWTKLEYYIEGVVRLVYIATILCTFLILSSVTSRSGADCMSKRWILGHVI